MTNREVKSADLINIKITREGLNNPELITIPKNITNKELEKILNNTIKNYK